MTKKKVVVGMSGGVDSSVAAYLLKEQGYEVIGVTMQIWPVEREEILEESGGCCGFQAAEDARRVASVIGIPHYVMNFRSEFEHHVIDYFVDSYIRGTTPNPCIACNRYVKWEALLERSLAIGADFIATGHYARIERLANGRYSIRKANTRKKDQTYALYNLTQEQLKRTLMPIGDYDKEEIRKIAKEAGLPVYDKPDSQDICFVPDGDYAAFIEKRCGLHFPEGNFVTLNGKVLGKHHGIIRYTVGQRKGLGLSMGHPVYVLSLHPDTNEVVVGDDKASETCFVRACDLNYMATEDLQTQKRYFAKIRYNHKGAWCTVRKTGDDEILCVFDKPVRAPAPGQALVLYDGEYVAGGGTIIERYEHDPS